MQDAAGLFKAARQGDAQAMAIVEGLCRVMGRILYNLVATLDLLLPKLQAHLPALTDGVPIVPAGLGEKVGDYAALALVA